MSWPKERMHDIRVWSWMNSNVFDMMYIYIGMKCMEFICL